MSKEEKLAKIDAQEKSIKEAMENPDLCKGTASTFSRVSGYYRSVSLYNTGKQQEFRERKTYRIAG